MRNTMSFFTIDDIHALSKVGGREYLANNPEHIDLKNNLMNGVWEKTKYWHNSVLDKLREYGYTGQVRKIWHNYGKSFKFYTWTQIYKVGHEHKGIYFTVGVDGDPETSALIYKLDCDQTGHDLTSEQKQIVQKLIKESDAGWLAIEENELRNYSWDKLIKETVDFIIKFTSLYDDCIESAWNINLQKVARIIYNENSWVMPSGKYGKSKNGELYESVYGYGHEEWLFDLDKLYNGYHYAFLEPIRKQHQAYVNKKFDIYLFTINSESTERFFVGKIFDVEVISEDEAKDVNNNYDKFGWLREMKKQIIDSSSSIDDINELSNDELVLFNIRFLPCNVRLNPDVDIPISRSNRIYSLTRYNLVNYTSDLNFDAEISDDKDFVDDSTEQVDSYEFRHTQNNIEEGNQVTVRKYNRPSKVIEISYLHDTISNMLFTKLQEQFGECNVSKEQYAGYGANRIDMVVHNSDGDIFYEIKSYTSLRISVREAFGQLMEYAHWMDKQKAKELIIVTQDTGESKKANEYLSRLRALYNIPIYYQYFNIERNYLSEKI